jgi:hypothetical protein
VFDETSGELQITEGDEGNADGRTGKQPEQTDPETTLRDGTTHISESERIDSGTVCPADTDDQTDADSG